MTSSISTPLRPLVLALVVFGMAGTLTELVLLEHFESAWQWAPFVALGAGLGSAGAHLVRRSAGTLRLFRAVMGGLVLVGLVGLAQHFLGNRAFELEMRPSMAGTTLVWESLKGATPALAPGVLIQLGLLGLLYTYRHPLLSSPGADERPKPESPS